MPEHLIIPSHVRMVALLEGVSYIFLLFIAMPIKYMLGVPEVVKYTGWIHGVLVITFAMQLLYVFLECKWSFKLCVIAFASSLVPFGTFWLDGYLKKTAANS